jgi:hypothetical protein
VNDVNDEKDPRDSVFVRLAAGVGDLGNPFYREERQRDVWNEASAVGMQLTLWAGWPPPPPWCGSVGRRASRTPSP